MSSNCIGTVYLLSYCHQDQLAPLLCLIQGSTLIIPHQRSSEAHAPASHFSKISNISTNIIDCLYDHQKKKKERKKQKQETTRDKKKALEMMLIFDIFLLLILVALTKVSGLTITNPGLNDTLE